jgi:8-oxo-dGTP pyrophosphatase MutT (NUDIX family)
MIWDSRDKEMVRLADAKIDYAKQLAALAWRVGPDGAEEFLLVTSRISKNWLIPKGWPITGKSAAEAALQEAFEEAGVKGRALSKPLGKYNYVKILNDGTSIPCLVKVFGMQIATELEEWPEMHQRERGWFERHEAALKVSEPGLAEFLATVKLPLPKHGKSASKQKAA